MKLLKTLGIFVGLIIIIAIIAMIYVFYFVGSLSNSFYEANIQEFCESEEDDQIVNTDQDEHTPKYDEKSGAYIVSESQKSLLGDEYLGEGYFKTEGKILKDLRELDVGFESFQVLRAPFTRDKTNIYHMDEKMQIADILSFEVLSQEYSKDKLNVYFGQSELKGVDVQSFVALDDGNYDLAKIGIDRPSAKGYAKDNTSAYIDGRVLEEVDAPSFEFIGNGYTKDKHSVFFDGQKIEEADPDTFELFEPTKYVNKNVMLFAKDKVNLYYNGEIIPKADRDSFEILNIAYAKDKNHVYHWSNIYHPNRIIFSGADPDTFQIVGRYPKYTKDKNHVYEYFTRKIVKGLGPDSMCKNFNAN